MMFLMKNEFFEHFSWAVPLAFSDPLGACRFEEGDVLYDSKVAYEAAWGEAKKKMKYCIQVKSPPRGPRTKSAQDNASVFEDNWVQQVVFDLIEFPSEKTTSITTTQGRLYSCLRFGELRFDENESDDPNRPRLAQDLMKELKGVVTKIDGLQKVKHYFIMPFDITNTLLREKYTKIEKSLRRELRFEPVRISLSDIDPELAGNYTATSEFLCFKIKNGSRAEVEKALKEALYTPAKNKITDVDRFTLSKHGMLGSI